MFGKLFQGNDSGKKKSGDAPQKSGDAPHVTDFTIDGKPDDSGYSENLLLTSAAQRHHGANTVEVADFAGPYTISVAFAPNSVQITLTNAEQASKTVTLQPRIWTSRLNERCVMVNHHHDMLKGGSASQIENADYARRGHHDKIAEQLQKTFQGQGVTLSHGAARSIIGAIGVVYNDRKKAESVAEAKRSR